MSLSGLVLLIRLTLVCKIGNWEKFPIEFNPQSAGPEGGMCAVCVIVIPNNLNLVRALYNKERRFLCLLLEF